MKIYFINVYRRHWEFYPEEQFDESLDDAEPVEGGGMLRWLQRTSARAWRSVATAEGGFSLRLRRMIERLNSRVDPTEPMLRRIRQADKVQVTYPSGISAHYVRRRLRLLLLHKTSTHRRWLYINAAILPVTAALGLLPGPNVFLAWNGYRLYSHLRALHGGQKVLNGQVPVEFVPDADLNELLSPEDRLIRPLDGELAASIGVRFGLPGLVDYLRRTGSIATDEQV
ncbi:MAG TPA: hypothetical protein PLF26_14400 [Blastocatellia bacterium]|nr:hypothetical protein [Blastocatellia bacterium]